MTPLMIEIMLKCYYSYDPAANCIPKVWNSPAAHSARELLIDIGVIDTDLRATPKGVAYIQRLLAVDPNPPRIMKPERTITIGLTVAELDWLIAASRSAAEDIVAGGGEPSDDYPGYTNQLTSKLLAARTELKRNRT